MSSLKRNAILLVLIGGAAAVYSLRHPATRAEAKEAGEATTAAPAPTATTTATASAQANSPAGRIAAALEKHVPLEFKDEALEDVANAISKAANIPVEFDEPALKEAGIGLDTPVTFSVRDVSLQSGLRLLLRPFKLTTITTADETLLITTGEAANVRLSVRMHNVRDLIIDKDEWGEEHPDYDAIIELITSIVRPQSWDTVGGPGSIKGIHGAIALSQTDEVHAEIADLLGGLREAWRRQEKSPGGAVIHGIQSPKAVAAADRFREILAQPWELEFKEQPLNDVMAAVSKRYHLEIQFDDAALKESGLGSDTPVSFDLKGITLRGALSRILERLKLVYLIKDEVLLITTREAANTMTVTYLYPVADLVKYDAAADDDAQSEDALIEAITAIARPQSWDLVGGPGSIKGFRPAKVLVVSQTAEVHEDIEKMLVQMRANLRENPLPKKAPVESPPADDKIVLRVFTIFSIGGRKVPAADLAEIVKETLGAKVWRAEGVFIKPIDLTNDGTPKGVPTGAALVVRNKFSVVREVRRVLKELDLTGDGPKGPQRPFVTGVPVVGRASPIGSGSTGLPGPVPSGFGSGGFAAPGLGENVLSGGGFSGGGFGGGAAFAIPPGAASRLGDTMPPPEKCDGHDGECAAAPK